MSTKRRAEPNFAAETGRDDLATAQPLTGALTAKPTKITSAERVLVGRLCVAV